ncbi:FliM/FliN family flagellar motor switch protein [Buchnera aphidicola]|nr:FliM/FliN family flagellar motor switch protein [Buchnera aphidicola]
MSYKKETLDNFLKKDIVEKIKVINNNFIKKIEIKISNIIQKDIQINNFFIDINSFDKHENTQYLYSNNIEFLPLKIKSFLYLSDNFLSVFTDFLFGGNSSYENNRNLCIRKNLTYIENYINEKIVQLIIDTYCSICKKFFSINIKILNVKIVDRYEKKISLNETFITHYFNLKIKNIDIFFVILVPLSIFKEYSKNQITKKNRNLLSKEKIFKKNIFLKNIHDVKLNMIVRLLDFYITEHQFKNLSIGDVLEITCPDKVIGYIEKKPIFQCSYKKFNQKSVIFLEKIYSEK